MKKIIPVYLLYISSVYVFCSKSGGSKATEPHFISSNDFITTVEVCRFSIITFIQPVEW